MAAMGKDRVGIRLSPFGVFNDMPLYPEMEADYTYLAQMPPSESQVRGGVRPSLVSVAKLVDFERGHVSYADFIGITVLSCE
jgi:hypothetical protein